MPMMQTPNLSNEPDRSKAPAIAVLCLILATFSAGAGAGLASEQSIVVLVNDDPITEYSIRQRMKLKQMSPGRRVQAAAIRRLKAMLKAPNIQQRFRKYAIKFKPKSKAEVRALQKKFVARLRRQALREVSPSTRGAAIRELINERLQVQEAKRVGITIGKDRIDKVVEGVAKRNKQTVAQFKSVFTRRGVKFEFVRQRYKAQIAWRGAIRRRYGRQVSIGQKDIDAVLQASSKPGAKEVELQLQKVTLALPGKIDQRVMAEKFAAADRLRRAFRNCKQTATLVKKIPGAHFQDLGRKKISTLSAEARPMLAAAEPVQMTPPIFSASGVEIYAVCAKRLVAGDDKQRRAARNRLEQEQLGSFSRRLLQDLCNSATIEFTGDKPRGTKSCG